MSGRRSFRVPGLGYSRQPVPLGSLEMLGRWLVVREDLAEPDTPSGLVVVRQGTPHAMMGEVLAAGPEAELEGVSAGDRVAYEEWQGGRWALKGPDGGDERVLVMEAASVLAVVR